MNYKILANSNLDDITDKYWRKNIKKGYCLYDFISEVKKMKYMQRGIKFCDLISHKFKELNYEEYYHPALLKLREYDKINKTDFYNTLFIYLKNNQGIQNTSDELLIHRNTMRYRIQKVVEIINIDTLNNENMFNIYVSYKISDYANKFKKSSKL